MDSESDNETSVAVPRASLSHTYSDSKRISAEKTAKSVICHSVNSYFRNKKRNTHLRLIKKLNQREEGKRKRKNCSNPVANLSLNKRKNLNLSKRLKSKMMKNKLLLIIC